VAITAATTDNSNAVPASLRSHENSSQTASTAWTDEQDLGFLELLLDARRQGLLNIPKEASLKTAFEGMVEPLSIRFPGIRWNSERLKNRYRRIKDRWRAFAYALTWSGTVYDEGTGRISLTKARERQLQELFKADGKKAVQEGLLISSSFTLDEWKEVFSDNFITRSHIVEADDDDGFAALQAHENRVSDGNLDNNEDPIVIPTDEDLGTANSDVDPLDAVEPDESWDEGLDGGVQRVQGVQGVQARVAATPRPRPSAATIALSSNSTLSRTSERMSPANFTPNPAAAGLKRRRGAAVRIDLDPDTKRLMTEALLGPTPNRQRTYTQPAHSGR
jgi:hypothetical protein